MFVVLIIAACYIAFGKEEGQSRRSKQTVIFIFIVICMICLTGGLRWFISEKIADTKKSEVSQIKQPTKTKSPISKQPTQQDSINITSFDSRSEIVLYNAGNHKVFVSHLSWRSLRSGKLIHSSVVNINKYIESKGFLIYDLKTSKEDSSEWGTGLFTEDFWQKIILKSNLSDTECIHWHFFYPEDPSYQTIKRFLGGGVRTVPADATLYYYSSIDGHLIGKNLELFAVPFLYRTRTCGTPDRWIILPH